MPKTSTSGQGRPKGVPNKSTIEFRETVSALLAGNSANVSRWLEEVAEGSQAKDLKPDPGKALDLMAKLAEFAAPKLARTEHVGDGGGPVRIIASNHDEAL
jgi:hypothetical protein